MLFEHSSMTLDDLTDTLRRCREFYLEVIELPLNRRTIEQARFYTLDAPPPLYLPCVDPNCRGSGINTGEYAAWLVDRKLKNLPLPGAGGFDMAEVVACNGLTHTPSGATGICYRQYQIRMRCRVLGPTSASWWNR